MINVGPKRKSAEERGIIESEDVIIKYNGKTSILTQEMRAQGMNLTQNLLRELSKRNLAEIKTVELVRMVIQMFGFFIPKAVESHNDSVIDITNADVKNIINQIGMGGDKQ